MLPLFDKIKYFFPSELNPLNLIYLDFSHVFLNSVLEVTGCRTRIIIRIKNWYKGFLAACIAGNGCVGLCRATTRSLSQVSIFIMNFCTKQTVSS